MPPRFSRPRLIDADDKQYRAFLQQIMLGKDNQRPIRAPLARELFGGEAETALRQWLAEQRALSERRLVEYQEHRGRSVIKKYRELDAVVLLDNRTIEVYEIKASQKATSLRRAAQQLRDTRSILRMLFPRVSATILLVDTGIPKTPADAAALVAEWEQRPGRDPGRTIEPPLLLDEVLTILPHVKEISALDEQSFDADVISLLRFAVEDVIAIAGAENLHLDWDEEELSEEPGESESEEPRFAYSTDAEQSADEDESPLAAALRKAMEGN